MKTEDLIQLLSLEPTAQPVAINRYWNVEMLILAISILCIGLLTLASPLGYRENYLQLLADNWLLIAKQCFPIVIAAVALAVVRVGRFPESSLSGITKRSTMIILVVVSSLFLYGTIKTQPPQWLNAIKGHSLFICLPVISVIALIGAALWLRSMQVEAITQPKTIGFWVGLNAGAITAFAYAFICTEDNPMFFAVWYTLAMIVVGIVSSLIAPRVLRW